MIEISEEKYWRRLNYYDGLLYCQLLEVDGKNDWRMIKEASEIRNKIKIEMTIWVEVYEDELDGSDYWRRFCREILVVIPVRDI